MSCPYRAKFSTAKLHPQAIATTVMQAIQQLWHQRYQELSQATA